MCCANGCCCVLTDKSLHLECVDGKKYDLTERSNIFEQFDTVYRNMHNLFVNNELNDNIQWVNGPKNSQKDDGIELIIGANEKEAKQNEDQGIGDDGI